MYCIPCLKIIGGELSLAGCIYFKYLKSNLGFFGTDLRNVFPKDCQD